MNPERISAIKLGICFWIFGICNNFPYVIMLSAANDILKKLEGNSSLAKNGTNSLGINLQCTKSGTGAILIADIIPSLVFKLIAPLFIQKIKFPHKIMFVVLAAVFSFIIVGSSDRISTTILGVVLASLSSGVGEVTFLGLTSFFDKNSISFWSSGTGGAGVFGALSYAGLSMVLTPENTLFSVAVFPVFILIFYMFVLEKPNDESFNWTYSCKYQLLLNDESEAIHKTNLSSLSTQKTPVFREKLLLIKSFLFLTIPLMLVYLFEYVINQGLYELLYFPHEFLNQPGQYRWYQVTYQIGVFISRSSINLVKIRRTWIFSTLQAINVILFVCQIAFRFIPNLWIVFIIILYEGLLGGAAYVNTFYFILTKSNPQYKEFNMSAASFWDSLGISLAGVVAIPIHNALCVAYSK